MKRSLRNLFRALTGQGATRTSRRPAATARPQVEALEERAVPTMNLTNYNFALPGAVLHVTSQTGGTFSGTFVDGMSGITVPVTGQLTPLGPPLLDAMSFGGMGQNASELEWVAFGGQLLESQPPLMTGQLNEQYAVPTHMWTTAEPVQSYGWQWIGPAPLAGIPGTGQGLQAQPAYLAPLD
jgi:hypothetical protein